MTALIWISIWLLQVLPATSELPLPVNVNLTSVYFNHMLRWEPGPETPAGVYYNVDVKTDVGLSWTQVADCERVQHPLMCSLTEAFSERDKFYYARIRAQLDGDASQPVHSPAFKPIRDTFMELPVLTVKPCDKNLCVDLQPPVEHVRDAYESLQYKLNISYSGVERTRDIMSLERVTLENPAPGREYCVSICFSDSHAERWSNYSWPVCDFSPSSFDAGALIYDLLFALLGLFVLICGVIFTLLISAGYICLKKRPLPLVLTSIHHLEEVLVAAPHSAFLSSLLNVKPTPPSSGKNGSRQTSSDESDEDSETESTSGRGGGGGYNLRVGTNLLSSSYTSSSALSVPLSPASEPAPSSTSKQASDPIRPPTEAPAGAPTHTLSNCEPPVFSPLAFRLTSGGMKPSKEEEEEEGSQGVNLLTLMFGRQEEMEEELHVESETTSVLSAPREDTEEEEEAELESCSDSDEDEEEEEEEEEDQAGYMTRPSPDILRNFK